MILGIDPGLLGAFSFMDENELILFDMPTYKIERNGKSKSQINLQHVLSILKGQKVVHCYLESVNAMPGQGVSSMFQMGRGYGQLEMALTACNIPLTYITPQVWKKSLAVPKDKDGARYRASQLMPQWAHNWHLKKHDGRAEASLIALYGRNLRQ